MANTYTSLGGLFTAIANAIRAKKGTTGTIVADNFPSEIESIASQPLLQSKTVSPSTATQTITPDSGYDGLSQVVVNAISPTKGAQTYTPTTTDQTISSGRWLTGAQTIKGDANLVASNIKSGVSIFGVNGELPVPNTINVTFVNNTSFGLFLRFTDTDFSRGGGGVSSGKTHTFTMPADSEGYGMFVAYIFANNDSSVWNYNLNKSNGDVCDAYDGQTQVGTKTKYLRLWFEEKQVYDGVTYTLS